jgi:hypothetical protein
MVFETLHELYIFSCEKIVVDNYWKTNPQLRFQIHNPFVSPPPPPSSDQNHVHSSYLASLCGSFQVHDAPCPLPHSEVAHWSCDPQEAVDGGADCFMPHHAENMTKFSVDPYKEPGVSADRFCMWSSHRHSIKCYTHKTSCFKTSGLQNVRFTKHNHTTITLPANMAATEPADFQKPKVLNIYGCYFATLSFEDLTFCKPDIL